MAKQDIYDNHNYFENSYQHAIDNIKAILFDITSSGQARAAEIMSKYEKATDKRLKKQLLQLLQFHQVALTDIVSMSQDVTEKIKVLDDYSRAYDEIRKKHMKRVIKRLKTENEELTNGVDNSVPMNMDTPQIVATNDLKQPQIIETNDVNNLGNNIAASNDVNNLGNNIAASNDVPVMIETKEVTDVPIAPKVVSNDSNEDTEEPMVIVENDNNKNTVEESKDVPEVIEVKEDTAVNTDVSTDTTTEEKVEDKTESSEEKIEIKTEENAPLIQVETTEKVEANEVKDDSSAPLIPMDGVVTTGSEDVKEDTVEAKDDSSSPLIPMDGIVGDNNTVDESTENNSIESMYEVVPDITIPSISENANYDAPDNTNVKEKVFANNEGTNDDNSLISITTESDSSEQTENNITDEAAINDSLIAIVPKDGISSDATTEEVKEETTEKTSNDSLITIVSENGNVDSQTTVTDEAAINDSLIAIVPEDGVSSDDVTEEVKKETTEEVKDETSNDDNVVLEIPGLNLVGDDAPLIAVTGDEETTTDTYVVRGLPVTDANGVLVDSSTNTAVEDTTNVDAIVSNVTEGVAVEDESFTDISVSETKLNGESIPTVAPEEESKMLEFNKQSAYVQKAIMITKAQGTKLRNSSKLNVERFNKKFLNESGENLESQLISNGFLPADENVDLEALTNQANDLYKAGKVEEAQALFDKISEINSRQNGDQLTLKMTV